MKQQRSLPPDKNKVKESSIHTDPFYSSNQLLKLRRCSTTEVVVEERRTRVDV